MADDRHGGSSSSMQVHIPRQRKDAEFARADCEKRLGRRQDGPPGRVMIGTRTASGKRSPRVSRTVMPLRALWGGEAGLQAVRARSGARAGRHALWVGGPWSVKTKGRPAWDCGRATTDSGPLGSTLSLLIRSRQLWNALMHLRGRIGPFPRRNHRRDPDITIHRDRESRDYATGPDARGRGQFPRGAWRGPTCLPGLRQARLRPSREEGGSPCGDASSAATAPSIPSVVVQVGLGSVGLTRRIRLVISRMHLSNESERPTA
jgi:hypothetical protein